jgi:hypothetical protein
MPGRALFRLIACVIVIAIVAGCGGGSDQTGQQESLQQQIADQVRRIHHQVAQHLAKHQPSPKPESPAHFGLPSCEHPAFGHRHAARLLNQAHVAEGWFPIQELWPLKSEWSVANCHRFTVVDAGGDAPHPSRDGLFGIVRMTGGDHEARKMIRVPGAGALTITKAPLGPSVVAWAPVRGDIEFRGENGVTGTLHLKDDTVTLNK